MVRQVTELNTDQMPAWLADYAERLPFATVAWRPPIPPIAGLRSTHWQAYWCVHSDGSESVVFGPAMGGGMEAT